MKDQNSQQGSDKALENKKGNFTQVPNELIEYLMQADLTKRELRICIFLIRELLGWDYELKPLEIADFEQGTKLPKQNVIPALAALVEKQIVKRVKLKGFRTLLYGFNKETFERVLVCSQPRKFYEHNGKVIDLMTFKVLNSMSSEVIESMTEKRRIEAIEAASRVSKYNLNTPTYLNLREITEFLSTQKKQTRARWEVVIQNILTDYPNDEVLLWSAIELVTKTGKDFFDKPIKRSVIGLFEGDWRIMRVAMQAKISALQHEQVKKENREQNQRKIEEVKNVSPLAPLDVTQMSPLFRKYATMGSTNQ